MVNKGQKSEIQSSEMRFLWLVKGCMRTDKLRNTVIKDDLHIFSINYRVEGNKTWRRNSENSEIKTNFENS